MSLDLGDDAGHRLDGEPRVRARRRFCGEHDRVGAIEDRVGDVTRLGARRARVGDHRLQHLGGGDHRSPELVAERDDLLLRDRHFLERQFHAQVAARDHDGVRGADDALDILERGVLLDLCHDEHLLRNLLAQLGDVLRAAHEAQREELQVVLDREGDVSPVLCGDGWRAHGHPRQVHALVALDHATMQHASGYGVRADFQRDELNEAIIHEDAVPDLEVVAQILVGRGKLAGRGVLSRYQYDVLAIRDVPWLGEVTDANARSL